MWDCGNGTVLTIYLLHKIVQQTRTQLSLWETNRISKNSHTPPVAMHATTFISNYKQISKKLFQWLA